MFPEIIYSNGNLMWDIVVTAIKYRIYRNELFPSGENWVLIYEGVDNQCPFNYPAGEYEVRGQYQEESDNEPIWVKPGKKKIIDVTINP